MLGRCTTGPTTRKARCCDSPWLVHSDRENKKGRGVRFLSLPAPAGVAYVSRRSGRRRQHPVSRSCVAGHVVHEAGCFPKTTKREVQPRLPELLVPKPAIQAVARHVAHLVVEGRPSGASPFETERDEVDRYLSDALVRQSLDLHRWRPGHHWPHTLRSQGVLSTEPSTTSSTLDTRDIHTVIDNHLTTITIV